MTRRSWAALLAVALLAGGCVGPAEAVPGCGRSGRQGLTLMAQALPDAEFLPCMAARPGNWLPNDLEIEPGRVDFFLRIEPRFSAAGGELPSGSIAVGLRQSCDVSDASAHPSPPNGPQRFDQSDTVRGRRQVTRMYVFAGGCVTQRFDVSSGQRAAVLRDASTALGLAPRERVNLWYEEVYGRPLEVP